MATTRRRRRGAADERIELARLPAPPERDDDDLLPPVAVIPPTASELRAERELDTILEEIGQGDVLVKISRLSDTGAMQSCGQMAGDTFNMETLTDTFGGGKYLLRFTKGKQELDRTRVEVDALIPPRNPRAPKGVAPVAPQQDITGMTTVMSTMMTMMMSAMSTQQQGSAAMITAMTEMMRARPAEKDPMEIAMKMAELMRANPGANSADLFSIFEKGMNVARRMDGGGDGDGMTGLLTEGVKGVTAALEAVAADKRARADAVRPTPIPATVPVSSPVTTPVVSPSLESDVPTRVWMQVSAPFREQFAGAMGLFSPATVANAILEKMDDDHVNDLVDDVEDQTAPGFVRRVFAWLRPGQMPTPEQAQWIADVAGVIVASMEDDAPDVADVDGAVSDTVVEPVEVKA